jgi:hypothetical protein
MAVVWQAVIVGVLAGLVGLTEIVSRYRSDPSYPLKRSLAAWLYVGLNAAAGIGALFLIRAFGWTFGQSEHIDLWRILVASFGAIAFFRSSLFVTKVGGSNVGVGPSLVLGALLDAFDRDVDRKSAKRMSTVLGADKLAGLNPDSVMSALPVLCLALMQNFSPSDQALLGTELIKTQNDKDLTAEIKMRAVIVHLAKYLGAPLVLGVLENAHEVFQAPPPAKPLGVGAATMAADTAAVIAKARQLGPEPRAEEPSASKEDAEPAPAEQKRAEQPVADPPGAL